MSSVSRPFSSGDDRVRYFSAADDGFTFTDPFRISHTLRFPVGGMMPAGGVAIIAGGAGAGGGSSDRVSRIGNNAGVGAIAGIGVGGATATAGIGVGTAIASAILYASVTDRCPVTSRGCAAVFA